MANRNYIVFSIVLVFGTLFAQGASALQMDEVIPFFVDPQFDALGREQLQGVLVRVSERLAVYVDKAWWDSQTPLGQNELLGSITILSLAFETHIYPTLTSALGSEWNPGVDGDQHITLLVHPMRTGANGYFRTADEYLKFQAPDSNEREMIYISVGGVQGSWAKNIVAHELVHLITFNQKEKKFGIAEETWLNEARAEYAPTLLGYATPFEGSYLQKRIQDFLAKPTDSLAEWRGAKEDYGVVNAFTHYLADQYGVSILVDSLRSEKRGILSLNEVLQKMGAAEDFGKAFANWTQALVVNDCVYGNKYCFLTKGLDNTRLFPTTNFLPLTGDSTLTLSGSAKDWGASWYRFIGGHGVLRLEFSAPKGLTFTIPYIIQKADRTFSFNELQLHAGSTASNQTGELLVQDFGTQNIALVIIPSLQSKIAGFDGSENSYPISLTVSTQEKAPESTQEMIDKLVAQVAALQAEIARLKALLASEGGTETCQPFTSNLRVGSRGEQVKCLQEILKKEGVYPEGLVTGYFGFLTRQAVIRFQEKYAAVLLTPLGLSQGTGFVGSSTRAKLIQLLP